MDKSVLAAHHNRADRTIGLVYGCTNHACRRRLHLFHGPLSQEPSRPSFPLRFMVATLRCFVRTLHRSASTNSFPLLNHIIIYSFHLANTFIVYFLLRQLKNSLTAVNTTTLLFYITPAMLGTVFDTDDINQVACLCFDMLGLIAYLQFTRLYEAKDVSSKQQLYLPLAG